MSVFRPFSTLHVLPHHLTPDWCDWLAAAMSTATELVHLRNKNPDLAAASRMTRDRSRALLIALLERLPGLREEVVALTSAVQPWESTDDGKEVPPAGSSEEWVTFTRKWRYNAEQRDAIRAELTGLL